MKLKQIRNWFPILHLLRKSKLIISIIFIFSCKFIKLSSGSTIKGDVKNGTTRTLSNAMIKFFKCSHAFIQYRILWNEGRWIVELGILAEQLENRCNYCGALLHLSCCIGETRLLIFVIDSYLYLYLLVLCYIIWELAIGKFFRYGLGNLLTISCFNCGKYNIIPTGKQHKVHQDAQGLLACWDINTKVAMGNSLWNEI